MPFWSVRWRACAAVIGLAAIFVPLDRIAAKQPGRGLLTIRPGSVAELREWAPRIDSLRRSGDLRLRIRRDDLIVSGRIHERYDQFHRGIRVVGADVAEQLNRGQMVSAFGNIYEGIDIDTSPSIDADRARQTVEERAGVEIGRAPELVVLPRGEGGESHTSSRGVCARPTNATSASTSSTLATAVSPSTTATSRRRAQSGRGQGVLGDTKKISVSPSDGQFVTTDRLRPPAINTYDMRGDYQRTIRYLNDVIQLTANDLASDSDNTGPTAPSVDAHVYAGYTYDYYFKRFGRRGLDNRQPPLISLVHPVRRPGLLQQTCPIVPDFYHERLLRRRRRHGLRRGIARGVYRRRPDVDYFSRRARHRRRTS